MEYASKSVGTAALTTGIIGTALSAIVGAGGISGILGHDRGPQDSGDRPVTRYEMGLIQENNAKNDEIVLLKSAQYTDSKAAEQAVFNATVIGTTSAIQQQIGMLQSITRVYVPNDHLAPGWGPAFVSPFIPTPIVSDSNSSVQTSGSSNG